jgi:hypothetical protein
MKVRRNMAIRKRFHTAINHNFVLVVTTGLFATTYTQQSTHGHADQIAVTGLTSFLTVWAAEIETHTLVARGSLVLHGFPRVMVCPAVFGRCMRIAGREEVSVMITHRLLRTSFTYKENYRIKF